MSKSVVTAVARINRRGRLLGTQLERPAFPGNPTVAAPFSSWLQTARGDPSGWARRRNASRKRSSRESSRGNLRTQSGQIPRRAGLEPRPRPFHALRASTETELATEYPVHVVTAWLGNTPKIAVKHYLMTTESDFSEAVGELVQMSLQDPVQLEQDSGAKHGAAACRSESREVARNDISRCETTAYAKSCDDLPRPAKLISGEDRTRTPLENTGNIGFFDRRRCKFRCSFRRRGFGGRIGPNCRRLADASSTHSPGDAGTGGVQWLGRGDQVRLAGFGGNRVSVAQLQEWPTIRSLATLSGSRQEPPRNTSRCSRRKMLIDPFHLAP